MAENYGDWGYYDRENGRPVNLGDSPFNPKEDHAGYEDDSWDDDNDDEDDFWEPDPFDDGED